MAHPCQVALTLSAHRIPDAVCRCASNGHGSHPAEWPRDQASVPAYSRKDRPTLRAGHYVSVRKITESHPNPLVQGFIHWYFPYVQDDTYGEILAMCVRLLIVVVSLLLSSIATADSSKIKTIYVFGDSLSDIGNDLLLSQVLSGGELEVPPSERYFEGRFSNGPVWVDQLAAYLKINKKKFFPSRDGALRFEKGHSISYAHGGSGTFELNNTPASPLLPSLPVPGLLGQVNNFGAAVMEAGMTTAEPSALYVIWSGANDYLLGGTPGTNLPPPDPVTTTANILAAIETLYELGAREFMVANLPDLGNIPISALLGPEIQQNLALVTNFHNDLLLSALGQFTVTHENSTIHYLDVFSLIAGISSFPRAFGFTNTFSDPGPASNCLIPLFGPENQDCSALPFGLESGGSVFWDSQHPSTELHRYIAIRSFLCLKLPGSCAVESAVD
jgi:phospholipase/lecithinase/hemolysin